MKYTFHSQLTPKCHLQFLNLDPLLGHKVHVICVILVSVKPEEFLSYLLILNNNDF